MYIHVYEREKIKKITLRPELFLGKGSATTSHTFFSNQTSFYPLVFISNLALSFLTLRAVQKTITKLTQVVRLHPFVQKHAAHRLYLATDLFT